MQLVKDASLFRSKQEQVCQELHESREMLAIVVYGKVRFGVSDYYKGSYFYISPEPDQPLRFMFVKKSAVFLLDRQLFQDRMNTYQIYYTKKIILEKTLPLNLLRLTTRRLSELIDSVHIQQKQGFIRPLVNSNSHSIDKSKRGIYVVFDGKFGVLNKEGVKLLELSEDYFGEEILWEANYEYTLSPESHTFKFIYLSYQLLDELNLITPERLAIFKHEYLKRKRVRLDLEKNFNKNMSHMKKFIKSKETYKPKQVKLIENKKHIFSQKEKKQFETMIKGMRSKKLVPKWMKQEMEIEQAEKKQTKSKHKYFPTRVKGKSFSTLTGKYFNPHHHQRYAPQEEEKKGPLVLSLTMYERVKASKMFKTNYFSNTLNSSKDGESPIKIKRTMSTINTEMKTPKNYTEDIQALEACLTEQDNNDEHTIKVERWPPLPSQSRQSQERSMRRPSTAKPTVNLFYNDVSEQLTRQNNHINKQSEKKKTRPQTPDVCSYYSLNYDRTYSQSISHKAKLDKYDQLLNYRMQMVGKNVKTVPQEEKQFQQALEKLDKTWQDPDKAKKQERRRKIMREHLKKKILSEGKWGAM